MPPLQAFEKIFQPKLGIPHAPRAGKSKIRRTKPMVFLGFWAGANYALIKPTGRRPPGPARTRHGTKHKPVAQTKRGISNTTGRNTPGRPVSARGEPKQQGARQQKMNKLSSRQARKVARLAKDVVIDTIGDKVVVRPLKRAFGKLVQPSYLLDYIAVEKPRSKTR